MYSTEHRDRGQPCMRLARRLFSEMMADAVYFRMATLKDKQSVLLLRTRVYVTEYLIDRFEEFVCDPNRLCIIGQIQDKVAVFVVIFFTDDGKTAFLHSARVRQGWEGLGYYRQAMQLIDRIARTRGCSRKRFEVLSDSVFVSSERFKTQYELKSRMKSFPREVVPGTVFRHHSPPDEDLKPVSGKTMLQFLSDSQVREHLFPDGLIVLNDFVYRAEVSNIRFLFDGCARLFHNVRNENGVVKGLLSSVSCKSKVVLNVIGQDDDAVEGHIRYHCFHCKRLCQVSRKRVVVEIVTTNTVNCERIDAVLELCGLQPAQSGSTLEDDVLIVESSYV